MSRKQTIYSGKLATPIPGKEMPNLLSGEYDPEWRREFVERFKLLFQHYGIDRAQKNSWVMLAIALAETHVPGLSEAQSNSAGRPSTKNSPLQRRERAALLDRVEVLRNRRKLSEFAACKRVWEEIKRKEPNNRYFRRQLGTVRADVALARKERRQEKLAAAFFGGPFSGFGFGFSPDVSSVGPSLLCNPQAGDGASLPENSSGNSLQKSR